MHLINFIYFGIDDGLLFKFKYKCINIVIAPLASAGG